MLLPQSRNRKWPCATLERVKASCPKCAAKAMPAKETSQKPRCRNNFAPPFRHMLAPLPAPGAVWLRCLLGPLQRPGPRPFSCVHCLQPRLRAFALGDSSAPVLLRHGGHENQEGQAGLGRRAPSGTARVQVHEAQVQSLGRLHVVLLRCRFNSPELGPGSNRRQGLKVLGELCQHCFLDMCYCISRHYRSLQPFHHSSRLPSQCWSRPVLCLCMLANACRAARVLHSWPAGSLSPPVSHSLRTG